MNINISMWLRDGLNSSVTRHCMAVLPDPFLIFPKVVWARDYIVSTSSPSVKSGTYFGIK